MAIKYKAWSVNKMFLLSFFMLISSFPRSPNPSFSLPTVGEEFSWKSGTVFFDHGFEGEILSIADVVSFELTFQTKSTSFFLALDNMNKES